MQAFAHAQVRQATPQHQQFQTYTHAPGTNVKMREDLHYLQQEMDQRFDASRQRSALGVKNDRPARIEPVAQGAASEAENANLLRQEDFDDQAAKSLEGEWKTL